MSMKVDSSAFLLNFRSKAGTISIIPSAYGRSTCSFGDSGAFSGSIFCAMITELVVRSGVQKSGTVTVCLISDIFGAGAFFCCEVASFSTT